MKTKLLLLILILGLGLSCSEDPADPEPVLSTETDILSFSFTEATGAATISKSNHTIDVEVEFETNLTDLSPTFSLSTGATSVPSSGSSGDYSSALTINVTAQDGVTKQAWTVNVTVEGPGPSNKADILTFSIPDQTGIDGDITARTIDVVVPLGTNLTTLTPTFTLSPEATSSPESGTSGDYTSPVTITVTAEDETTTLDWVVTVTEEGASTATDILAFSFNEQTDPANIDATNHTVDVEVINGTVLTALSPTFTLSEGATSSPATGASGDYSGAVTITVTAQDGATTEDWTVNVTETPGGGSTASDILSFSISDQSGDAVIDATNHTVDVDVVNGTALTALIPTFTLSSGATSLPETGTSGDYSSAVTITVTAEDATTTQDWTVNVTEAAAGGTTTVIFADGGTKATGITDLVVDGVTYDVEFIDDTPLEIYGTFPGTYTFTETVDAEAAMDVINSALNDADATAAGQAGSSDEYDKYRVGVEGFLAGPVEQCRFRFAKFGTSWVNSAFGETTTYDDESSMFAKFTEK